MTTAAMGPTTKLMLGIDSDEEDEDGGAGGEEDEDPFAIVGG